MKKIVIGIVSAAVVVGGVSYYVSVTKQKHMNDVTLREVVNDTNANKVGGCPREVTFGDWGCTTTDADCNKKDGSLMLSEARQKCNLPNDSVQNLSEEQFNCAMSACQTSAMQVDPNQEKLDKTAR